MYNLKLIYLNDEEYIGYIYWKEAKVISNKEFIIKWYIPENSIEYEVKLTDEKVEVIQSFYLANQLRRYNFKSLTVEVSKQEQFVLFQFYFKTVILPNFIILKETA